ncbi:MAG: hypothetical protein QW756_00720 [Nitrososphaerota archaeon]
MRLSPPPRIKFLEALGTVADGRVKVVSDMEAEVMASEGDRVYRVFLDVENGLADSDDNGTRFRNYIGYPIIAFLMVKGLLMYEEKLGEGLKGLKWRSLNEKYKSYRMVEAYVKELLVGKGVKPAEVDRYISEAYRRLSAMNLRRP